MNCVATSTLVEILRGLADDHGLDTILSVTVEPWVDGHDTETIVVTVPADTFVRAFCEKRLDTMSFEGGMALTSYGEPGSPIAILVAVVPE